MSDLSEEEKRQYEHQWYDKSMKNWRAWGSWFSWGSPVGLALFYAIIMVATGVFIWLIHHS